MTTPRYNIVLLCLLLALSTCQGRNAFQKVKDYILPRAGGCSLSFADFPDKEPVFLNADYTLIEPQNSAIELKTNEEIIIACPGPKNTLNTTENKEETAKCYKDQKLKIGKKEYDLSVLNCTRAVAGELDTTSTYCANDRGVIKNIGHKVGDDQFDLLINICYEDERGEAIYAEHVLYGSAIKNAKKDSSRPGFKTPGLGPGVGADVAYKQATQKATFSSILGSSELAEQYINSKSFLARGHLSPDGDFVYISSQYSSYFYINTVPQWQAVNNGNWKSLEFAVRNTAANLNNDLRVWTGGWLTLQLEDTKGRLQDIYLVSKSKLPVPKYSWKVVQDSVSKKAIAFVTINNPFKEEIEDEDVFCTDICGKTGWGGAAWSNLSKGYTYCCEVGALRKVIKTIPDVKSSGILENNNNVVYKFLYG